MFLSIATFIVWILTCFLVCMQIRIYRRTKMDLEYAKYVTLVVMDLIVLCELLDRLAEMRKNKTDKKMEAELLSSIDRKCTSMKDNLCAISKLDPDRVLGIKSFHLDCLEDDK